MHDIGFVDDPGDVLQDRIRQVMLMQHRVECAVTTPVGQAHSGNIERFHSVRQRCLSDGDELECGIAIKC